MCKPKSLRDLIREFSRQPQNTHKKSKKMVPKLVFGADLPGRWIYRRKTSKLSQVFSSTSLLFQAFDDECLRWMNRDHNVASATQILDQVSSLGQQKLSSFSIDLMFARPNQGLTAWMNELEFVQSRFPNLPHISLYELTVEKSTPLQADVKSNKIQLPSEEEKADLYQATVEILAKASYECYEVSNFATKKQHRGQHNSRYWQGGTFIGLGPGAHGRYMIEGKY